MKKTLLALALLVIALPTFAQNRTSFAGLRNAFDYAYGIQPAVAPLRVDVGNTTTGAGTTVTLAFGYITLPDGTTVSPVSTTAPITIGIGANAETVTPTGVSCGTPFVYSTCSITAAFANLHGTGDIISSGTFGLAEAVNSAHTQGGLVVVTGAWKAAGGVNGTITATHGWNNVSILDARGTASAAAFSYHTTGNSDGAVYVASSVSWY